MRKEIILAIVAGTLVGLVVAVGLWRTNSVKKTNPQDQNSLVDQAVQNFSNTSLQDVELAITSHQSNSVVTESTINLEGVASADSWIAISAKDNLLIQPQSNGVFSTDVELSPGLNQILVTAFTQDGNEKEEERLVLVYLNDMENSDE